MKTSNHILLIVAGFILLTDVLNAQTNEVQGGIFSSGDTLIVKAKPSVNFTSTILSGAAATIQWPTSYGVSLGIITATSYSITKQGPEGTSGSNTYQKFATASAPSISWTANAEIELFRVVVNQTGSGTGVFELTNTIVDGEWYIEIAGLGKSNPTFYQASTSNVPLPVQLVSFTASANLRNVELRWGTATEVRNYGFEVERRKLQIPNSNSQVGNWNLDIGAWTKVGFVPGAGTSNSPREYTFVDNGLAPGRYAYRIKQIDNDGTFEYFHSAEVEVGTAAKVLALEPNYPNPFNPSTKIEFTLPENGPASLKIYNTVGQEVATLFNQEAAAGRLYQVTFDGSQFSSGVYYYTLDFNNQRIVKKMMLVK